MAEPVMNAASFSYPAISVVMPLYNKEREVARAISSVLAQTFVDYELVVVDDGSTDGSPAEVATFDDPRIRMIRQENAGVSAARNRGIDEARADLIAFLDADDEWSFDYLETILRLNGHFYECGVYATGYAYRREGGYTRPAILRGLPEGFDEGILDDYFRIAADSDPPLWTSAITVKKSCILAIGGFPVGIAAGEDLLTWARLAFSCPIAYSAKPRAFFWDPADLSARHARKPAEPDLVGEGLKCLLVTSTEEQCSALRRYYSLWKRMRGVVYLKQGNREKALAEFKSAIHYGGISKRLRILQTLAQTPAGDALFRTLLYLREAIRLSCGAIG